MIANVTLVLLLVLLSIILVPLWAVVNLCHRVDQEVAYIHEFSRSCRDGPATIDACTRKDLGSGMLDQSAGLAHTAVPCNTLTWRFSSVAKTSNTQESHLQQDMLLKITWCEVQQHLLSVFDWSQPALVHSFKVRLARGGDLGGTIVLPFLGIW